MSIIHKALQQTGSVTTQATTPMFNPLARWTQETPRNKLASLFALALLMAALLVLLLPQKEVQQTTLTALVSSKTELPGNSQTETLTPSSIETIAETTQVIESTDDQVLVHSAGSVEEADGIEGIEGIEGNATIPSPINTLETNKPDREAEDSSASTIENSNAIAALDLAKTDIATTSDSQKSSDQNATRILESEPSSTAVEAPNTLGISTPTPKQEKAQTSQLKTSPSVSSIITPTVSNWQREITQYINSGQVEQAEQQLKQWIATSPKDPVPRIWLAKIYISNGLYKAAEPLVQPLQTREAKALTGLIYERTERPNQAASVFERLYKEQPEKGRWLLFWAINLESSGQLDKSQVLYQNYLKQFALEDSSLSQFAQTRLRVLQRR